MINVISPFCPPAERRQWLPSAENQNCPTKSRSPLPSGSGSPCRRLPPPDDRQEQSCRFRQGDSVERTTGTKRNCLSCFLWKKHFSVSFIERRPLVQKPWLSLTDWSFSSLEDIMIMSNFVFENYEHASSKHRGMICLSDLRSSPLVASSRPRPGTSSDPTSRLLDGESSGNVLAGPWGEDYQPLPGRREFYTWSKKQTNVLGASGALGFARASLGKVRLFGWLVFYFFESMLVFFSSSLSLSLCHSLTLSLILFLPFAFILPVSVYL